jgi:MFS family permease
MGKRGKVLGNFAPGWRQVWLSMAVLSISSMITTTYGVLAVPLMQEFGPSRMVLMLTISVLSVVTSLLSPGFGALMDRVALRPVMATGVLLIAGGYLALSLATEFWQVLVIFGALIAPGQVVTSALSATVLLSRWFSAIRGRAMGIALTGVSLGGIVFPILVQTFLDHTDWRTALRLFALTIALIGLPCALLVINRPSDVGFYPDGGDAEPEHAAIAATGEGELTARQILADPTFWMLALILAIIYTGMRGIVTNIAPLAADEGIDATLAAVLLSSYSVCGVIAKLTYAAISDRVDPRRLLLVVMVGATASHLCLTMAEQGLAMIAAGAVLMGLFGGAMMPMQSYLVPRIFGRDAVGKVYGLLGLAMFLFTVGTPPLFGLIHDVFGNYDVIFALYAALMAAAMALVRWLRVDAAA